MPPSDRCGPERDRAHPIAGGAVERGRVDGGFTPLIANVLLQTVIATLLRR